MLTDARVSLRMLKEKYLSAQCRKLHTQPRVNAITESAGSNKHCFFGVSKGKVSKLLGHRHAIGTDAAATVVPPFYRTPPLWRRLVTAGIEPNYAAMPVSMMLTLCMLHSVAIMLAFALLSAAEVISPLQAPRRCAARSAHDAGDGCIDHFPAQGAGRRLHTEFNIVLRIYTITCTNGAQTVRKYASNSRS